MKWATIFLAATMGLSYSAGRALSADDADQQKTKRLEPLRREVQQFVRQYYPDATVTSSYDAKTQTEKVHFEFNTQSFIMRYRDKNGEWQKPVEVRGPYVGGIWCDMVLKKGRYDGDIAGAEKGVTEAGPDFYSHLIAPYSKKQDSHMKVTLRYPGGTPPKFLKQFDELTQSFAQYLEKPVEE
jgi:hypothetical protein